MVYIEAEGEMCSLTLPGQRTKSAVNCGPDLLMPHSAAKSARDIFGSGAQYTNKNRLIRLLQIIYKVSSSSRYPTESPPLHVVPVVELKQVYSKTLPSPPGSAPLSADASPTTQAHKHPLLVCPRLRLQAVPRLIVPVRVVLHENRRHPERLRQ